MIAKGQGISSKGFSLVELLVVVAILGLVMMSITSLYKSTERTAYTQDEVVDVQQNIRIAMDQIARDLRMAGFMIPAGQDPISPATADSLTIQTSSAAGRMARVDADFTSPSTSTTPIDVSIAFAEMVDLFEKDDYVRIIRPPNHTQPIDNTFLVDGVNRGGPILTLKGFGVAGVDYKSGDVIVRVPSSGVAHPNTITYSLADDPSSSDASMHLLQRNATGTGSLAVADNITTLQFTYLLDEGTETDAPAAGELDDIRAVRVTIMGATDATKTGQEQYSGVKTRGLTNLVKLRNR
jgi:prepilin-type N-terminal cleavage/methylation domain-containing protein